MREIPLTCGLVALVDDEDAEWLGQWRWYVRVAAPGHNYAMRWDTASGRSVSMHRLIMDAPSGGVVDHIDGNGLNNQRNNLRLASVSQNLQNRVWKDNQTGYKGVYRCRHKFKATIKANRTTYYLGVFDTAEEAYESYREAARRLHGEFARFE